MDRDSKGDADGGGIKLPYLFNPYDIWKGGNTFIYVTSGLLLTLSSQLPS